MVISLSLLRVDYTNTDFVSVNTTLCGYIFIRSEVMAHNCALSYYLNILLFVFQSVKDQGCEVNHMWECGESNPILCLPLILSERMHIPVLEAFGLHRLTSFGF